MENSKPLIFLSAADERVAPLTSKNRQRDNADGSPAPKDSKSGVNLEGYVRSPARGLGVANGRPHISRIERSRRSMHAARGVSDEMLDGQVRLGGTFRHIWASGNIAISPHSNYKDLSEYRHNRSSLHPCSVRDGPRSLPHLPAGRAQPKGQSQRRSMRHFLAVAAPHHSTRNSAQRQAAKKRPYVAPAIALDVRSRLGHVPYMFTVRGGFHGSALPFVRRGPLAQSGQGDADVRPRRGKRVPAPALARDGRQAGLPELRLPGLL